MSRLRRLKQETRKNRIKAASCGLALALSMGSVQGLGTYALFTDTEEVPTELAISTGDIDVEINKGKIFENMEPSPYDNYEITIPVKITNYGTLNQNIKLDLSISDAIKPYLTEAEYIFNEVEINNSTNEVENGVMYNKEGNSLFVLAPGDSIEGTIKMDIKRMDRDIQNNLSKTPHSVEVKVKSTQISDSNEVFNNGFYDEATQINTITIAQKDAITINAGKNAFFTNGQNHTFRKLYIPINFKRINNSETIEISAIIENENYTAQLHEYTNKKNETENYILIQDKNGNAIEFKSVINITINVKVKLNGQEIDNYQLKCHTYLKNGGNDCDQSINGDHPDHGITGNNKCHDEIIYNGHRLNMAIPELEIKPTNEEVEMPIQPDVVEQPKQELEIPSEPEVVEPPKKETIEVPNQLEVIEPPKENEGIQE